MSKLHDLLAHWGQKETETSAMMLDMAIAAVIDKLGVTEIAITRQDIASTYAHYEIERQVQGPFTGWHIKLTPRSHVDALDAAADLGKSTEE